jgi:hypothetical protein
VRAANKAAEPIVFDVVKHLRTWPSLGRSELLEAGILVLNHNHREAPGSRPAAPFRRREFVESLNSLGVTVIAATQICAWWAAEDFPSIEAAVTSPPRQYPSA